MIYQIETIDNRIILWTGEADSVEDALNALDVDLGYQESDELSAYSGWLAGELEVGELPTGNTYLND